MNVVRKAATGDFAYIAHVRAALATQDATVPSDSLHIAVTSASRIQARADMGPHEGVGFFRDRNAGDSNQIKSKFIRS